MLPTFGLITEGETDQVILKNILIGYFQDYDLIVRPLQPSFDATDGSQMSVFGGWYNVFKYCESDFLLAAFAQTDFLIIQIDSDCSHEKHFDVPKMEGEMLESFVERIKMRLKSVIEKQLGNEFYEIYAPRILFAIAVDEIECWLLPLYYTDKTQSATNNCLFKLNKQLPVKDKINPNNNNKRTYQRISKEFMKAKAFQQAYPQNPSFRLFIEDLVSKLPLNFKNE
jgi:Domain of unknown function (DUF4276)